MNCAAFENDLMNLLAGELTGVERNVAIRTMREHMETCETCAASRDLLKFAATDPRDRFPDDDPGAEYWESFDARLQQRISVQPKIRWYTDRRIWAAAAVIALIAVLAGWFLIGNGGEPMVAVNGGGTEAIFADYDPHGIDPTAMDTDAEAGWLFPDTEDLDAEARQELLDWLEEEAATNQGDQA
jgi:hypothetical protein